MTKRVSVRVQWADFKMARLPTSGQYITAARFRGQDTLPTAENWSVVVNFDSPADTKSNVWNGTAEFLVKGGPSDLLKSGTSFDLLEGNKISAKVQIL